MSKKHPGFVFTPTVAEHGMTKDMFPYDDGKMHLKMLHKKESTDPMSVLQSRCRQTSLCGLPPNKRHSCTVGFCGHHGMWKSLRP